ncbi:MULTISPECIES: hypothetical protein [unclassified Streptomyces]|uniref:hypothetical protein n=1 Tax=unclassified Streptomyces TaxID=2593676 RepID=UPI003814275A
MTRTGPSDPSDPTEPSDQTDPSDPTDEEAAMGEGPQVNEGIVLSGNAQVHNAALAAGRYATATTHNTGGTTDPATAEALRDALETIGVLRRRLARAESSPDLSPAQREEADAEADALEGELASDEVDRNSVTGRLTRLRLLVGNATALLGLVASAQESVRAITGG